MRFQNLQFRPQSFNNFRFRGQSFVQPNAQPMQFGRITFPAFNSAQVRREQELAGRSDGALAVPVPPAPSIAGSDTAATDARWTEPMLPRVAAIERLLPRSPAFTQYSQATQSDSIAYSRQIFQGSQSPELASRLERWREDQFGRQDYPRSNVSEPTRWAAGPDGANRGRVAAETGDRSRNRQASVFTSEFRTAAQDTDSQSRGTAAR
jgi:hypothetical protein